MSPAALPAPGPGGALIAAYGTLRPGAGGFEHLELAGLAWPAGPCVIAGDLRLRPADDGESFAPALLPGPGRVPGSLLLAGPQALARIDSWEGHPDAYRRVLSDLTEPAGARAWVYFYQGSDAGGRVPGGDWLAYLKAPGSQAWTSR